ncbi:hypothetical protein Glove_9g142 [Diversispora epigaea]|uniref:Uncharacterized protein n=1 Tax=Diversispora epigaea TaxID=1348612 RepID=A0A397JSV2_9GLOM|nr:hypothetical protein Glove_9g142 [Diversispora epigaea]
MSESAIHLQIVRYSFKTLKLRRNLKITSTITTSILVTELFEDYMFVERLQEAQAAQEALEMEVISLLEEEKFDFSNYDHNNYYDLPDMS